jgi:hypothetical protein
MIYTDMTPAQAADIARTAVFQLLSAYQYLNQKWLFVPFESDRGMVISIVVLQEQEPSE